MRVLNKDPRLIQLRDFECLECGAVVTATKRKRETAPGHIKTMWCAFCKKETDHIQFEKKEEPTCPENCPPTETT